MRCGQVCGALCGEWERAVAAVVRAGAMDTGRKCVWCECLHRDGRAVDVHLVEQEVRACGGGGERN